MCLVCISQPLCALDIEWYTPTSSNYILETLFPIFRLAALTLHITTLQLHTHSSHQFSFLFFFFSVFRTPASFTIWFWKHFSPIFGLTALTFHSTTPQFYTHTHTHTHTFLSVFNTACSLPSHSCNGWPCLASVLSSYLDSACALITSKITPPANFAAGNKPSCNAHSRYRFIPILIHSFLFRTIW